LDAYKTTFDRHAFEWNGERVPMLWSHRSDEVVGSLRTITSQDDGMHIVGKLNLEIQRAREVRAMLAAGDINGLSIGFQPLKVENRAGGVRHFTSIMLREVSFVAHPAVPGSRVTSVRSDSGDITGLTRALVGAAHSLRKGI
jgi:HK97 family phage prohead protease